MPSAADAQTPFAELLLALQQGSGVLSAVFDPADRLAWANEAFRQVYWRADAGPMPLWVDMMVRNHALQQGELLCADDPTAWVQAARVQRRRLPYRAYLVELCDGRSLWMTETCDAEGWLLMVATDVTSLLDGPVARPRQHAGASSAGLAPVVLPERQATLRLLQRTLVNDQCWPLCAALLSFDAQAGAPGLQQARRRLQSSIRQEDGCGVFGPNEYLLILPTAGLGQGRAVVERVLARLSQPDGDEHELPNCSAGLVAARWGEPFEVLQDRLREALSRAVPGGRLAVLDD